MNPNKIVLVLVFVLAIGTVYTSVTGTSKIKRSKNNPLQIGDIIFQSSKSGQSYAVQLATGSKYSHVGMIIKDKGELKVIEAVQPVKITSLKEWKKYGDGNHYVVKRLKQADSLLNDSITHLLDSFSRSYLGKNYDLYFGWDDDRIYCSELVWKVYKQALGIELGKLQKLSTFDLSHPIVKEKLKERYGNSIPMNEQCISPGAMFDSELLELVVVEE